MSAIPPSVFASRLAAVSHDEFVSFVARLWELSGWETQVRESVVTVRKDEKEEQLLVLPAVRFARFRAAPTVDVSVDGIVTARRVDDSSELPRNTPDVPVADADDLRHRLLYGVGTDAGERLCETVLGAPLRGERWESKPSTGEQYADSLASYVGGDGSAPVSRRTTLGILGFGALGGIAVAGRSLLSGDGTEPDQFEDDPPPTPDEVTPPEVTFEFEYQRGILTITHAGGETLLAGNLFIRGEGLGSVPEYRWSESDQYTEESEVGPGSTLRHPVDSTAKIEIIWESDVLKAQLGSFSGPDSDTDGSEPVVAPETTFDFSFENGVLRISPVEGRVKAGRIVVRGVDFEEAPAFRWSETVYASVETEILSGQAMILGADDTVAVNVYWEHEDRDESVLLDQYSGPGRPLDGALGDVSTFGYDTANTGVTRDRTVPASGVTEQWSFDTGRPVGTTPAVVDGRVFVADLDGIVYALDADDGTELWRFETADTIWSASPTVVGDVVYVSSTDGNLYALDTATGRGGWRFPKLRNVLSSPTYVDLDQPGPTIFVSGEGPGPRGMLFAVDATDGSERWRFEIGAEPSAAPAVVDGTVYVGGGEATTFALDAADGTERWTYQEPEDRRSGFNGAHAMDSPPAVSEGTVFIGSTSGGMYALDSATGSEQWNVQTDGGITSSPGILRPSADGEDAFGSTVYVSSTAGTVYAFDATDGTERWTVETDDPVISSPAIVEPSESSERPTVCVGSFDFTLYALDGIDGSERWAFETGNQVISSPAITDGTVYFGSGDGKVYALRESE